MIAGIEDDARERDGRRAGNDVGGVRRHKAADAGLVSLAIAAMAAAAPAAAQTHDASVTVSSRYDSNLFRVPPEVRDSLHSHGEDVVTYVAVNGGVSTRIGVVAVTAQGSVGQTLYANNPAFNAINYLAAATGTYDTSRAEVNLSLSYTHAPVSFDESSSTRKISQSLAEAHLDGSHDIFGDIRLVGNVGYVRNTISGGNLAANGVEEISFGGGVGYFSPTGNSITIEYSGKKSSGLSSKDIQIEGRTVAYQSDYREDSIRSQIKYQITPITILSGSVGFTRHDDKSVFNADFRGLSADISLTWMPLPDLTITPAYRRGFSSESRLFSNGVTISSYSLRATEKLFGKLNISVLLSKENRLFRYDLQASNPLALDRTESIKRFGGGLSYTTGSKFQFGLDYQYISKDSTSLSFPYSANTITLTISRSF